MLKVQKSLKYSVFLLLLVPVFVHAAWWNPASWFKRDAAIEQVPVEQSGTADTGQQSSVLERVVEKVVPVEVIKERVRDNPDQEKRILELESELSVAREEIATLKSDRETVIGGLQKLQATHESNMDKLTASCKQAIDRAFDYNESNTRAINAAIQAQSAQYQAQQQQSMLQAQCSGSWRSASAQQACAALR